MKRVFVTGGTGFIGQHLVHALRTRGHEVTCLVRSGARARALAATGARIVVGDVTDPSGWRDVVQGHTEVYHLAGLTRSLTAWTFGEVNAGGAESVARVCAACDTPPVLVLVSSLAVAGPAPDGHRSRESDPPRPVSHYGRSKLAGERAASRFAADVPLSIVRPPIVVGPADRGGLALFRGIATWGWHFTPTWASYRYSVVHVSEVTAALLAVAEHGRRVTCGDLGSGTYYVTADETPTWCEFGRMIGRAVGRPRVRVLRNPWTTTWTLGMIAEGWGHVRRRPTVFNRDKAREAVAGHWVCAGDSLKRDTGFCPAVPLQQRLDETARWYRSHGWLPH